MRQTHAVYEDTCSFLKSRPRNPRFSFESAVVSTQFNPIGLFQRDAAGTAAFKCYTNLNVQWRMASCILKDSYKIIDENKVIL